MRWIAILSTNVLYCDIVQKCTVQVEHNTKYVIKKQGGNVTLDCTDFNGEQDVTWQKIGGGQRDFHTPILFYLLDKQNIGSFCTQIDNFAVCGSLLISNEIVPLSYSYL